jgi:hypothetical protein
MRSRRFDGREGRCKARQQRGEVVTVRLEARNGKQSKQTNNRQGQGSLSRGRVGVTNEADIEEGQPHNTGRSREVGMTMQESRRSVILQRL